VVGSVFGNRKEVASERFPDRGSSRSEDERDATNVGGHCLPDFSLRECLQIVSGVLGS